MGKRLCTDVIGGAHPAAGLDRAPGAGLDILAHERAAKLLGAVFARDDDVRIDEREHRARKRFVLEGSGIFSSTVCPEARAKACRGLDRLDAFGIDGEADRRISRLNAMRRRGGASVVSSR